MKDSLKVVIWGCGTNGQNLMDMLGAQCVAAFIDTNKDQIARGGYQGVPIISFETYLKDYTEYLIVISPMNYREIEKQLMEHQITWYLRLNQNKVCMAAFALLHEKLFIHKYHIDRNHVYYISGVNVFSLSLYYYLKENGIDSRLTAGDQEQKETLQMLKQKQMVDDFVTSIENEEQAVVIQTDDTQVCTQKKDSVLTYDDINSIICQKTKEDLKQFENCNQGKRAFIVALGPSITIRDLEKLEQQHELTISMNSIYYMLDKTTWRPDYYVISDGTGIRDYEKDLKEGLTKYLEKSEKFFSDNYLKFWDTAHDGTYHCFHQIQNIYDIEFTSDFSEKVYAGATVVYACIQLAVYMGIKNIYLLGCDFSFSNNLKGAENHCYGRESVFYNFDFEGTLRGYECAKKYADEHGIKIYNATRGGKLEVFERVDFDSLF